MERTEVITAEVIGRLFEGVDTSRFTEASELPDFERAAVDSAIAARAPELLEEAKQLGGVASGTCLVALDDGRLVTGTFYLSIRNEEEKTNG